MDIDDEARPKIRKSRSKWKCGLKRKPGEQCPPGKAKINERAIG
jgi:hypothetical protein